MKADKLSIKWKLYVYLTGFVGIMLIILWLFQIVSLERFYKSIKTQNIKKSAESIVKNIDHDNLQSLLEQLARQNDLSIKIVDVRGDTLYHVPGIPDAIINRMHKIELQQYYQEALSRGGRAASYGEDGGGQGSYRSVGQQVENAQGYEYNFLKIGYAPSHLRAFACAVPSVNRNTPLCLPS